MKPTPRLHFTPGARINFARTPADDAQPVMGPEQAAIIELLDRVQALEKAVGR